MRCTSCGFENPEGMKFCGQCASPFNSPCPQCGFTNPVGFAFCGQCATPLAGQSSVQSLESRVPPSQSPIPTPQSRDTRHRTLDPRPSEAERRQLTVMFCDLVGSTALSTQLDPEELREVMHTYQEACVKVVSRFDGYVAKYLGDGLLVYFGYPVAHEDDAQRAVRAGLGIVESMQNLNARSQSTRASSVIFQVRIGIHTGLVVAGEMGAGDQREPLAIVGETPNLTARIQGIATPDTVVISAATQRLTQGFFTLYDLGFHKVKGVSTPVQLYRVVEESGVSSRFEVVVATGLTPLVGREQEVGLLLKWWAQVKEGMGHAVLLRGEAGIGKSRLVQALKDNIAGESHERIECPCSPYYQNSALYPVIEYFHRLLERRREDSRVEKLTTLERLLEQYGFDLKEALPLFAALLSLPAPRFPLPVLTPQRQKQKTFEAVLAWFLKVAEQQPVFFLVEDLHWGDPSTLELLSLFLDQVPATRILLVLTFRPHFTPPWSPRSYMPQLMLSRLDRKQIESMAKQVAGGKRLPAEILQQVVAKTDGVPLFVEELTKMVLESGVLGEENGDQVGARGSALSSPLAIPATLHDSLMARLDRLGPAKEVAQLGATLGREFSSELIQAVSPLNEVTLQQGLSQLVEAELVYQRGLPPQTRYLFKHALIQDAAYQSLLKSRRQQYHQKIAQVLEEQFPETKETQPELLAHHYTEAGFVAQAIPYWQQAGQRAVERSANIEAIGHLTKGLELLKTLPDTPKRVQQELTLQIALGAPLTATKGYAAPEVGDVYTQARLLCQQVGEASQLFPVLFGLWRFYLQQADLQTARELGEQCLSLAQRVHDPVRLLRAHNILGITLYYLGELTSAREHLERGISLYNPQQRRLLAVVQDPMVACLSYAAWALWHLGYPDLALKRSYQALSLAQELSHPFSLAMALFFTAEVHYLRREAQAAREHADAAIALSTEQEFPFWLAQGTCLRGWALAVQGQDEEGITQMRQGLAAYQATGAELGRPYWLAVPAEVYGKVGRPEEGLAVLAEALTRADKTGEHLHDAELFRLKGELLLNAERGTRNNERKTKKKGQESFPIHHSSFIIHRSAEAEAEACFLKAIDIARKQQAKSFELRAAMNLSRLWQQQGKGTEARQLLTAVYDWFTEGLTTPDLQQAKNLLANLS